VIARIVLWNLADGDTTIDELRERLPEAPDGVPGLVFEAWISDESSERWGAVSVFDSRETADRAPAGRAGDLIGTPPDLFDEFDVETTLGLRPRG
jgi:hypothetical protein